MGRTSENQLAQSPWLWAGLLMLIFVVLRLVLGYDGMYGQDPYAYYNYAEAIQAHWRDGSDMGSFVWPRIYPLLGALWMGEDPAGWMQFLAMLSSALTLAFTIKLLQSAQPNASYLAPTAFLFIGLAPFLLRASLSVLSDTMGMAWMSWALWQGARYLQTDRRLHLLLAGLLAGLAIWTRYPLALLLLIPCLLWVWRAIQNRDFVGFMCFLPVTLLAAIPHFFILPHPESEGIGHVFQNINFVQWSPLNVFQREFVQQDGIQKYALPNLLANFGIFWHPRYLGIGAIATLGILARKRLGLPALQWSELAALALYGLFLSGIPFQNARFLLPMLPFAALLLGPVWNRAAEWLMQNRLLGMLAFASLLVLQLALGIYACRAVVQASKLDALIASDLREMSAGNHRLYEFGLEAMLQARQSGFETVSMWYATMPEPQAGDLLIFNYDAVQPQFEGMNPMNNWHRIADHHRLATLKTWEGGWQLYGIR